MALEVPSQADLAAATPAEIAAYVGPGLERLAVGWLPHQVFAPIRQRVTMSTVEVVAFQAGTQGEKVLLGRREADPGDRWWAHMLNLPGSVILPNEDLEESPLVMSDGRPVDTGLAVVSYDLTRPTDRILGKEFEGSVRRARRVTELLRAWVKAESGTENKTWVWTEAQVTDGYDAPVGGGFYDTQAVIDNPPEDLVQGHHYFIERALEAYQQQLPARAGPAL